MCQPSHARFPLGRGMHAGLGRLMQGVGEVGMGLFSEGGTWLGRMGWEGRYSTGHFGQSLTSLLSSLILTLVTIPISAIDFTGADISSSVKEGTVKEGTQCRRTLIHLQHNPE